ncbi:hypothetical protein [Aromatoleum tolulyticum]|uniref:hypothetical protein n=1 Tax=Aromatoleum tolulyticum TaxID=34027 RepID=UPI00111567B1|nr:hypothetical protein [Aromatoleum tolulyticum]
MKSKGKWLIAVGLLVMLGPIAIFIFMSALPHVFSQNTILLWHYLSAFGLIIYGPLGFVILVAGLVFRIRARRAPTES